MKPIPELLKIEHTLYEDFQRCAVQLCNERMSEDDWDRDSYFLMQHHNAPTRLLDWSDGALIALHFAVREKAKDDTSDAIVYVMEPYRLLDKLKALPDSEIAKNQWKDYVSKHPSDDLSEDEWTLTCLAMKTISRRWQYRDCRCRWISAISRAGSPPSVAASLPSGSIPIGWRKNSRGPDSPLR